MPSSLNADMSRDLRLATRSLLHSPGFSVAVILSFALAVGSNSAIFSALYSVLLRPLPFAEPERLVVIYMTEPGGGLPRGRISFPEFSDWHALSRSFLSMAVVSPRRLLLARRGDLESIAGEIVSPGYFEILGVTPLFGHTFSASPGLAGEAGVCLLSHDLWKHHFGSDAAIVGRRLRLGPTVATVIGVLPPGFRGLHGDAEIWVPMAMQPEVMPRNLLGSRGSRWLMVVARLREKVASSEAEKVLAMIVRRLEGEDGDPRERTPKLSPIRDETLSPELRQSVSLLAVAAGLLMLTACFNVVHMFLLRAVARQRELAVRIALGARRWDLLRNQLVESLLLALVGGALGLALAFWILDLLGALRPPSLQRLIFEMSWPVLAFGLTVSLLAGGLIGLLSALQSLRCDAARSLQR